MVARVARFVGQPERFGAGEYRWVLETIQSCEGFFAAYHLVDEGTGDSFSFSVFESEDAAREAEQLVGRARELLGREASPPDDVHVWRVVDSAGR